METLKKVLILLSSLGFLLVVIALLTPGWVLLDVDIIEMAAPQVYKVYKPSQQQQAEMVNQLPKRHVGNHFSMKFAPFFIHQCFVIITGSIHEDICFFTSLETFILMLQEHNRKDHIPNIMDLIKTIGWTDTSIIRAYIAFIVICALVLIQSFVSLILTIVYVCIRHPRKRLGIAGSVSSFLSGSIIVLIILFVLIVHGKTVSFGKESFGDAGSFGFPYSTVLCFIGCVLFIVNAVILTRMTLRSKEPFKYEMMVIDTSKGSGGTYVAKT